MHQVWDDEINILLYTGNAVVMARTQNELIAKVNVFLSRFSERGLGMYCGRVLF